jgi:hypothetical protein
MTTYRSGAGCRVVVGAETALGAGHSTPAGVDVPKASVSFNWGNEGGDSDELISNGDPVQPIDGLQSFKGQLVQVCDLDSPGYLFKRCLTSYTTATQTAAPFVSAFASYTTAKTSVWIEVGDVTAGRYDLLKGCHITGFSVSVTKAAQTFKLTWDFIGLGNPRHSTRRPAMTRRRISSLATARQWSTPR